MTVPAEHHLTATLPARPSGLVTLVVFKLADREYALPVEQVVEILRIVALTPLPQAPAWLAGVIDLRGRVLPVIDLRIRLGIGAAPSMWGTCIIVAQVGDMTVGLIADAVNDVLSVPVRAIAEVGAGAEMPVRWLSGIAKLAERLVLILDLPRICATSELQGLE